MGKVNESEAKAIVVKYLTNQNRPYSVNDLVANLHNEVPKALMQKTLDGLVEESKIKERKVCIHNICEPSIEDRVYLTLLCY